MWVEFIVFIVRKRYKFKFSNFTCFKIIKIFFPSFILSLDNFVNKIVLE